MPTLETLDQWSIRGLNGIVKMLSDRVVFGEGFSANTVKLFNIQLDRLCSVAKHMNVVVDVPDREASLAAVDNWFFTGFIGLGGFLKERHKEGPKLSKANLEQLKLVHAGLSKILEEQQCTASPK